jgi:outer membrane immunogenic protein
MKTSLTKCFLAFCALALAIPALAGPLPQEKNISPIAPAPECTWTGFYIGLNVGATDYYSRITDEGDFFTGSTWDRDTGAFIGGGQIGYNYQWNQLVFGVEADASGSTAEIEKYYDYGYWRNYGSVDFMSTFRLRAGISLDDNKVLLYATGGGAYAHGKWESEAYVDDGPSYYYYAGWRGEDWRWGWTAGFGAEYKLNCHWSVRGEALLTWLSEDSTPINEYPANGYYAGRPSDRQQYRVIFDDDLYTFRVGVNYSFWGGH